jgi:hypothetical protein
MQEPWRSIGNHQVRTEDDLFFVVARGLITDEDADALLGSLNAVHVERGRVIVIVDASHGVSVGPAARRRMAQESKAYGMVVFGAGVVVRSLIFLINNALRLITGRNAPLLFCADEQDARRLANALRLEQDAQKRPQAGP